MAQRLQSLIEGLWNEAAGLSHRRERTDSHESRKKQTREKGQQGAWM